MAILQEPVVAAAVAAAVDRVRADYIEMPGLSLTAGQMRRLWQIDADICDAVIDLLVASRFLRRRSDNSYVWRREDL